MQPEYSDKFKRKMVQRGVDDMLISRHAARHVISACFEAA